MGFTWNSPPVLCGFFFSCLWWPFMELWLINITCGELIISPTHMLRSPWILVVTSTHGNNSSYTSVIHELCQLGPAITLQAGVCPSNKTTVKKCFYNISEWLDFSWNVEFLLVVFRFFLMEFWLVFIHENKQLKTNINAMFENGCK